MTSSSSTRPSLPPIGAPLPGAPGLVFRREIARGGMAIVYEVEDRARGTVAAKILQARSEADRVQFRTERTLVARVAGDAVVPIFETFVTDDGLDGHTMELVAGETLETLLARGEIALPRAIALVASAAHGLSLVHAAQIVHRDIKPANLLIEPDGRVRIIDFGVAKDLRAPNVPEDEVTGTPRYFSPEQALALATTPATDVWALGVLLYTLVTGREPFVNPSFMGLVHDIVHARPDPPRSLNPALTPELDALILRCLEKTGARRFATAHELATTLETHLRAPVPEALAPITLARPGAPLESSPPPPRPSRETATIHATVEIDLESSPEELWPFVSNTEVFNRAIGLPAVVFVDRPDGQGGIKRTGKFRRLGMEIGWQEHPYEWVAPGRQSVLRTFTKGPLLALWSRVTLEPGERNGTPRGTRLRHEIAIAPRGLLGLVASRFEMRTTSPKIEAVYRELDARLVKERSQRSTGAEPTEPYARPVALVPGGEARLARGRATLEGKPTLAPLAPLLENALRTAPDFTASRLRPYALADAWSLPRAEALKLFVASAAAGLCETRWLLLCPVCRVPARSIPSLAELKATSHCDACGIQFDNDFARSVELVFRPAAAIRKIQEETYCLGGPGHSPHVIVQQELEPEEERRVVVSLTPGAYEIVARGVAGAADLRVIPEGSDDRLQDPHGTDATVRQSFSASPKTGAATTTGWTRRAAFAVEERSLRLEPRTVAAGRIQLVLKNESRSRRVVVRVQEASWRDDAVTGLEALGIPALRASLRSVPGEPIQIASAAFVAAALEPSLAPEVHAELAQVMAEVALDHGGALLPLTRTVAGAPSALLAAFPRNRTAFEAALELREIVVRGARARVGIHAGPALAIAVGEDVDYQGVAPTVARALLEECQPGELAATHVVLGEPAVQPRVAGRSSRIQRRRLGAEGSLAVIYLGD